MDLRQLRYFVHVVESKSFSRAATQLNVAQSALSRHMRVLENELGVRLLERHCRGVEPTAAGELLMRKGATLLQSLEDVRNEIIASGTGPAGTVSLAVPPSVSQIFAGPIIETCRKKFPHVELQLSEGWTGHICDSLLSRHFDLGILYSSQINDQLLFKPIFSEHLSLVISAEKAPPLNKESYTLREVAAMPLIVPPQPNGLRKVIETAFAQNDLVLKIAYESQIWSQLKEVVESGRAHAIMPQIEVAADIRGGRMIAIPIVDPVIDRTLGIAMAREAQTTSTVKAVHDLIGREAKKWPIFPL